MDRRRVSKLLNKEIAEQLTKVGQYNNKLDIIMECVKPGMVNHLLKKSSTDSLEQDCKKLACESVTKIVVNMTLVGTQITRVKRNIINEQTDNDDSKRLIRCEKKNRIKKMKRETARVSEHTDNSMYSSLQERIQRIGISRDSLQNELKRMDTECKSAQTRLLESQETLSSINSQIQNGDDVGNELLNLANSLSLLETQARKMIDMRKSLREELSNLISSHDTVDQEIETASKKKVLTKHSDLNELLTKQLSYINGVLCSKLEISKLVPKKCICKKKNKCKPYMHENVLEDSIFYTFIEKNCTSNNVRLAKIMEKLNPMLSDKNDYSFEFDIGKELYNIEFVWALNDIIYLIQSDIYIDGTTKFLFNKRWIKITI
uniref:Uncharacterized protein n=1 Tax=viral metagenome TaxID=1070528 RepID=A0A6C0C5H4_9ZZZZ